MAVGVISGIGATGTSPTPATEKLYQIKIWDNAASYTFYFISKTPIYNITDLRDYVDTKKITVWGYYYGSTRNTVVYFPEYITKDNLNIKLHYTQYTVSNASVVRPSDSISVQINIQNQSQISCTEIA